MSLGAIDRLLVLLHSDGGKPRHAQHYAFRFIHQHVGLRHLCGVKAPAQEGSAADAASSWGPGWQSARTSLARA